MSSEPPITDVHSLRNVAGPAWGARPMSLGMHPAHLALQLGNVGAQCLPPFTLCFFFTYLPSFLPKEAARIEIRRLSQESSHMRP